MRKLLAYRGSDLRGQRGTGHDVLVGLASILPVSHQNHRRAEIAGITHKAAGVPDGAGGMVPGPSDNSPGSGSL